MPLPEPEGPRSGHAGQGPPLRLLILGDSAAAGVGAPTQAEALSGRLVAALAPFATVDWTLVARTGATTAGTLRHLREHPPGRFDAALVSLGVNDLTRGTHEAAWRARMIDLLDHLRTDCGVTRTVLSGLPPMHRFPALPRPLRGHLGRIARRFDRVLAGLAAERPDCLHLALAEDGPPDAIAADGFHPGPALYRAWGEAAARIIRRTGVPGAATSAG